LKVVSPAGEFEIAIKDAGVEKGFVILRGQMGVWDSKIYLSPSDLWLFISVFFRPSIIAFILKLPFLMLFKKSQGSKNV
jgi:hypothetical protein